MGQFIFEVEDDQQPLLARSLWPSAYLSGVEGVPWHTLARLEGRPGDAMTGTLACDPCAANLRTECKRRPNYFHGCHSVVVQGFSQCGSGQAPSGHDAADAGAQIFHRGPVEHSNGLRPEYSFRRIPGFDPCQRLRTVAVSLPPRAKHKSVRSHRS